MASPILRRMRCFSQLVAIMVMIAPALAWGQPPADHSPTRTDRAGKADAPADDSKSADHRGHQTAEDLLKALQADRPVSEVILPASRAGRGSVAESQLLLPEGTAIIEQKGRLVRQGKDWDFQPDQGTPISVLPNARLEDMLAMHNDAGGQVEFIVSGEATVFGNQNYLLIKHAARAAGKKLKENAGDANPSLMVRADASADDVLSAIESQRPMGSGVPSSGDASASPSTAGGRATMIDGTLIVRRTGRLVRDTSRWHFEFDDRQATGHGSLALLPNQSLEIMTQSAERGAGGLVFIVSGEVTQFGPENFLLVRGVTRVLDLGNLRP